MTRRADIAKRIVFAGIIIMLVMVTVVAVLWNREHTPTVALVTNLPDRATLGQRYPVSVDVSLPWRSGTDEVALSVAGDFQAVAQEWSIASCGAGFITWRCNLQVMSVEKGPGQKSTLSIGVGDETTNLQLGPSDVEGLLNPDEDFIPVMSDYSPEVSSFPYALWGAVIFGVLAGAGFIFVLRPRPRKDEPLTPGEHLSKSLMDIGGQAGTRSAEKHQRISDEVRSYLSDVWDLPTATRSKDQLLHDIRLSTTLPSEIKSAVRDYLEAADKGKYAPPGQQPDATEHLNAAFELLNISESYRREEDSHA